MAPGEHVKGQPGQPKIKLYWLNASRSQRIAWLLEELGLDYDVELFQRTPDMRAPPDLRDVHPLGKAPVVSISIPSAEKPLILAESGFIVQYLCDHFAQNSDLVPKRYRDSSHEGIVGGETDEWMRYQYFLHYAEGSLMPQLLVGLILSILKSPKIPIFIRPITSAVVDKLQAAYLAPEISRHLDFLESQLATSPRAGSYLCGPHLTAADILLSFPLQLTKQRAGGLKVSKGEGKIVDKYPRAWEYLQRLEQEPGYKRAEARIKKLLESKEQTS